MTFVEYLNESEYKVQPKTKKELKQIIEDTIKEKGNNCDLNFIDTSLITNMSYMFNGCSSMVGTAVPIWTNTYCPLITGTDVNKFQDCFKGCTNLTNYYTEIPTQWGGGYSPRINNEG